MARGFGAAYGGGASDQLSIGPDADYNRTATRSYFWWVKIADVDAASPGTANYYLIERAPTYQGADLIYLRFDGSLSLNWYMLDKGAGENFIWALNSDPVIADETWVAMGLTHSGNAGDEPILYWNGSAYTNPSGTASGAVSISGTDSVSLGRSLFPSGTCQHALAEVGIWTSVLTAGNMTSLAGGALPSAIDPTNLIFYASLRTDLSEAQQSGTLTDAGSSQVISHPPGVGSAPAAEMSVNLGEPIVGASPIFD
jgi:hypothetical protein